MWVQPYLFYALAQNIIISFQSVVWFFKLWDKVIAISQPIFVLPNLILKTLHHSLIFTDFTDICFFLFYIHMILNLIPEYSILLLKTFNNPRPLKQVIFVDICLFLVGMNYFCDFFLD